MSSEYGTRKQWERRSWHVAWVVGEACPTCFLPVPLPSYSPNDKVCKCGPLVDADAVLAIHGLAGTQWRAIGDNEIRQAIR